MVRGLELDGQRLLPGLRGLRPSGRGPLAAGCDDVSLADPVPVGQAPGGAPAHPPAGPGGWREDVERLLCWLLPRAGAMNPEAVGRAGVYAHSVAHRRRGMGF